MLERYSEADEALIDGSRRSAWRATRRRPEDGVAEARPAERRHESSVTAAVVPLAGPPLRRADPDRLRHRLPARRPVRRDRSGLDSGRPCAASATRSYPAILWRTRLALPAPPPRSACCWPTPAAYVMARAPRALARTAAPAGDRSVLDQLPGADLRLEGSPPPRRADQEGPGRWLGFVAGGRRCSTTPGAVLLVHGLYRICRSPSCPSTPRPRSSTSACSRRPATWAPGLFGRSVERVPAGHPARASHRDAWWSSSRRSAPT